MGERKLNFKDKRWSLHGMTALVTGGSRGIGYAIVEELAEFGAAVHVCARNEADIDKCVEEWKNKGLNVTGSVCDVSSRDQRQHLIETVASIFHGKLNILWGRLPHKSTTLYLDPSLYGSIVFVSSIAGLKALPYFSIYASTKGATNQLSKNLALEWAKDNIRVNAVAPGVVLTQLLKDIMRGVDGDCEKVVSAMTSQTPLRRVGKPKDISSLVAFLSSGSFFYHWTNYNCRWRLHNLGCIVMTQNFKV